MVGSMRMRRMVVPVLLAACAVTSIPAGAQEPSPSTPAASPLPPSSPSPAPVTSPTATAGPRWSIVRDVDVVRSGILRHVVTLGGEAIAFAPTISRDGQTRVRVLVTADGTEWRRRGRIELTGTVRDVLADGATLLAVGWDDGAAIWRSVNGGRTWSLPDDPAPFAGGADGLPALDEDAEIAAIVRGPAGILAVGTAVDPARTARRAAAWRSQDGVAWERLVEVGALPPFLDVAADSDIHVAVGSDPTAIRWSLDGAAWTEATVDRAPDESIVGVVAVPGHGFLAWGSGPDAPGPLTWASLDGRTWAREPADAALRGALLATIRATDAVPPAVAVGGRPTGAFAFAWLGDAWRRDRIRGQVQLCARDVTVLSDRLIAVGGTCGADAQRGRAWVAPLEP
jgi:hypothetical protein